MHCYPWVLVVVVGSTLACGCAANHPEVQLPLYTVPSQPCDGPTRPAVVRVVDSSRYDPKDTLAFQRSAGLNWLVFLEVREQVSGPDIGPRLGVLVHSPSKFATLVWGLASSPQTDPAELTLFWDSEYCLYEVVNTRTPESKSNSTRTLPAPRVHAAAVSAK